MAEKKKVKRAPKRMMHKFRNRVRLERKKAFFEAKA